MFKVYSHKRNENKEESSKKKRKIVTQIDVLEEGNTCKAQLPCFLALRLVLLSLSLTRSRRVFCSEMKREKNTPSKGTEKHRHSPCTNICTHGEMKPHDEVFFFSHIAEKKAKRRHCKKASSSVFTEKAKKKKSSDESK